MAASRRTCCSSSSTPSVSTSTCIRPSTRCASATRGWCTTSSTAPCTTRWRQALLGGLITAGLFVLGRWAIGLYLSEAAPGSAYGSMGALVLLLVWMYYAAAVFFIGALIPAVLRSEDHTSELQSLMRISYAVFSLKKKNNKI